MDYNFDLDINYDLDDEKETVSCWEKAWQWYKAQPLILRIIIGIISAVLSIAILFLIGLGVSKLINLITGSHKRSISNSKICQRCSSAKNINTVNDYNFSNEKPDNARNTLNSLAGEVLEDTTPKNVRSVLYKSGVVAALNERGYNVSSVHKLNLILEEMGILKRYDKLWCVTQKGIPYTIYNSGTINEAFGWRDTVIDAVQEFLDEKKNVEI